jgi:hypothetical protein
MPEFCLQRLRMLQKSERSAGSAIKRLRRPGPIPATRAGYGASQFLA